jgi:predicted amidohydrolase YtcJ
MHPTDVGTVALNVDLTGAKSINEILERLRRQSVQSPAGERVLALNANCDLIREQRLPTRAELDRFSADRPVAVVLYDLHSAMLNSRMLETAGIPPDTSGLGLDAAGNPTGLVEDPAIEWIFQMIQASSETAVLERVQAAVDAAVSCGLTTLHMKETAADLATIFRHEAELAVRVKPLCRLKRRTADELPEILQNDVFRRRAAVAIYGDGAPDSRTAAFFEPYPADPANFGMLYYTDDEMIRLVETVHRAGVQMSIHACGTRAAEQALRAYETVLARHPRCDHRHRIEHFEMPYGNQIGRAADAGITLAMQPMFLFLSGGGTFDNIRDLLGDDRAARWTPLRTILDRGGLVAGGSDAPITPLHPLKGIQACVCHPNPKQRITRYEALKLFTVNAARIGFEEKMKGSIEPGKLADFTVLSENPYRVRPDEIGLIPVEMTFVGGRIVYDAETMQAGSRNPSSS